jgi:acetyl-CoA synthetase
VVGKPDDLKGEEIVAFITLEHTFTASDALIKELKQHVGKEIGAIARPGDIRFTDSLPKTRSGKIAAGEEITGDTSTLEDRSVLDRLRQDG